MIINICHGFKKNLLLRIVCFALYEGRAHTLLPVPVVIFNLELPEVRNHRAVDLLVMVDCVRWQDLKSVVVAFRLRLNLSLVIRKKQFSEHGPRRKIQGKPSRKYTDDDIWGVGEESLCIDKREQGACGRGQLVL